MTIAVDFDGVIHAYRKGWQDGAIYDPPMPGALDGLRELMDHDAVFIHTTRDVGQVAGWLLERGFSTRTGYDGPFWNERGVLLVTNLKLAATAYLDDRAVRFESWDQALGVLLNDDRHVSGDPRTSGGDGNIAGPGGPHDHHAVVVDTTNAVLLDHSNVCLMEAGDGSVALAVLLEGRINKTSDRARNLYLMNEDGAAALVTELLALANRIGPEFGERFTARLQHLIDTDAFTGEQGEAP